MSLKQELEIWSQALQAYDQQEFERCLDLFEKIADSAKILFNIGLVQATIGAHHLALHNFRSAIEMDKYLAVALFQSGVSYFLLGNYSAARKDFDGAYLRLRANTTIDYEQIGLAFKLFSCEVLFNRGLSSIYLGETRAGLLDLENASREKQTEEHDVIDEALVDKGDGYTVFSIPVGLLFRPAANKIKNLKTKDYLGVARLVAATDQRDAFTGFTGLQRAASDVGTSRPTPLPELRSGLIRSKTAVVRGDPPTPGYKNPPATAGLYREPSTPRTMVASGPSSNQTSTGNSTRRRSKSVGALIMHAPSHRMNPTLAAISPSLPSGGQPPTSPESTRSPTRVIDFSNDRREPRIPLGQTSADPDLIDAYYDIDDYDTSFPTDPLALPVVPTPSSQASDRVADWAMSSFNATRIPPDPSSLYAMTATNVAPPLSSFSPLRSNLPQPSSTAPNQRLPPPPPLRIPRLEKADPSLTRTQGSMRRPSQNSTLVPLSHSRSFSKRAVYEDEMAASVYGGTMSQVEEKVMSKIRIKLRYKEDVRGMSIAADLEREDFVERVRMKFGSLSTLDMKYKDADESYISIIDDDDWETAVDEARESAKGRAEGKLEIFVTDV